MVPSSLHSRHLSGLAVGIPTSPCHSKICFRLNASEKICTTTSSQGFTSQPQTSPCPSSPPPQHAPNSPARGTGSVSWVKAAPWAVLVVSGTSPAFLGQGLLQAFLCNLWICTNLLFIGYASSWLVGSTYPSIQLYGGILNSARKSWCTALRFSHLALLGVGITILIKLVQNIPHPPAVQQVLDLLGTVWPVLVVACVNVCLLGAVEGKRFISKARVLALDAEGPGRAHPIMVQGTQSSARLCVWACMLVVNLALMWLDTCRLQACVLAGMLILLQCGHVTVAEQAETLITRARPAVAPPDGLITSGNHE